jgi:hypothetical protein
MPKKRSCCKCKQPFQEGQPVNKFHGNYYCDSCYPGVPPHIGRRKINEVIRRQREINSLKITMPGMEKEIDEYFGEE